MSAGVAAWGFVSSQKVRLRSCATCTPVFVKAPNTNYQLKQNVLPLSPTIHEQAVPPESVPHKAGQSWELSAMWLAFLIQPVIPARRRVPCRHGRLFLLTRSPPLLPPGVLNDCICQLHMPCL